MTPPRRKPTHTRALPPEAPPPPIEQPPEPPPPAPFPLVIGEELGLVSDKVPRHVLVVRLEAVTPHTFVVFDATTSDRMTFSRAVGLRLAGEHPPDWLDWRLSPFDYACMQLTPVG